MWLFLKCLPGSTHFIWSDILPRPQGAGPDDFSPASVKRMDERRVDCNRFARRLSVKEGGGFIKHPSFRTDTAHLYRADGLHLSAAGCFQLIRDIVACVSVWGVQ